jgi:hypothetical protein
VDVLILVNAMIPRPNETAGEWGKNTASAEARVEAAERGGYGVDFDFTTYFFHDVPGRHRPRRRRTRTLRS